MFDLLYPWLKAFHLIAVIFWMAGLLYLPRLFVYHSAAQTGGELEAKMEEAEAKLLRIIMNPAMIGFLGGGRPKSEKFFRRINEVPALVTVAIVILAVVQPF